MICLLVDCPSDFTYKCKAGRCYKLVTDRADFDTARNVCRKHSGSALVSVTNKDESDSVTEFLIEQHKAFGGKFILSNTNSEI